VQSPGRQLALAVIGALATVVRLSIALVEVVKQKRERERDAPAYLGLSWALGCKEQTACGEQNKKRFHGVHFKLGERSAHPDFSALYPAILKSGVSSEIGDWRHRS
jgi:hypothetical protein